MTESIKELILTDKIRKPSYEIIINWIDILWNAVNNSLI